MLLGLAFRARTTGYLHQRREVIYDCIFCSFDNRLDLIIDHHFAPSGIRVTFAEEDDTMGGLVSQ